MKLELRYENSCPSYHGEGPYEEPEWYFPLERYDTYIDLFEHAAKHWNWRAFSKLYIGFADDYDATAEEQEALKILNETFKKDLEAEKQEQQVLETAEHESCRIRVF